MNIGSMQSGPRRSICDVPGVLVGHATIIKGDPREMRGIDSEKNSIVRTGVTVIVPHSGNIFREKVAAAAYVLNGFGKSTGLVQVQELGSIETPIALTNTLCVGRAYDALVEYSLARNPDIGLEAGTVNPVVGECNDGYLNDIRGMHVTAAHVHEAIAAATQDFERGAVGAGTGMSCFELKGGIGSASRLVSGGTLGALVLSNFGILADLRIDGEAIGERIAGNTQDAIDSPRDKGSILIVLATDLPLSDRQLYRVAKRAMVGLARTGSYAGQGSGDISIAFSTANRIIANETRAIIPCNRWNESMLDPVFRAAAEATEEAIVDSMLSAPAMTGRNGHHRKSLKELYSGAL